jgi:hypothetical protein
MVGVVDDVLIGIEEVRPLADRLERQRSLREHRVVRKRARFVRRNEHHRSVCHPSHLSRYRVGVHRKHALVDPDAD